MKKNLLTALSSILLSVFLLAACDGTNTDPAGSSSAGTPTPFIQADAIPQQPHHEATFEDMATFINTVNADTFESGNFKNIIEQVRADGYIVRPYYDGEPSTLYETVNGTLVVLCPEYENAGAPPKFLYHLIDGNYRYRIDVWYMEEEFLPIAAKWSHPGVNWYKRGDTEEKWIETTPLKFERQTVIFGDVEAEVTIITDPEDENSSYASFVWDKYIIEVRGNTVESEVIYDTINLDILSHLSFEKMPLNPEEAPVSPTQIPTE